jgi:hypothetical protein
MSAFYSDLDDKHVFEVNGWAVLCHTTLFRTRYILAVRTPDGELTTCDGYYDEPLVFLLARFDLKLLDELLRCLELDKPRRGEDPDPTWEARREAVAHVYELARANEADPMCPLPFDEGKAVFAR